MLGMVLLRSQEPEPNAGKPRQCFYNISVHKHLCNIILGFGHRGLLQEKLFTVDGLVSRPRSFVIAPIIAGDSKLGPRSAMMTNRWKLHCIVSDERSCCT
eukprot:SAG31_NODE_2950_length_4870_cov_3.507860_5_plen_100_part_00